MITTFPKVVPFSVFLRRFARPLRGFSRRNTAILASVICLSVRPGPLSTSAASAVPNVTSLESGKSFLRSAARALALPSLAMRR